jgi:hypothetical protein
MRRNSNKKSLTKKQQFTAAILKPVHAIRRRTDTYLKRRPHRSFQMTRRRDYRRSLQLPGFIAFTQSVNQNVWQFRRMLFALAIVYAVLTALLIGVGSQETYSTLTGTLQETGSEVFSGNFGELGKAGLLFVSIAGSGLNSLPTESQQIYAVILGLLIWLTTIWLLRNALAGHKVKMRDGLYSAGAPLVATFLVSLAFVVQLLPIGIAILGFNAASTTGLLSGGVEALLFWVAAALLSIMSLYWVTSTFFAMIIVTLPGMYPLRALRTAGDMVIGRRLRILLRILWMFLCIILTWVIILVPFILLDGLVKRTWTEIEWVPIIPFVLMALGVVSFIWSAVYIYLLYRKVVDDDAKPAL